MTEQDFNNYIEAKKITDKYAEVIYKRIIEVILLIGKACDDNRDEVNWWFPNAGENEVGEMSFNSLSQDVNFEIYPENYAEKYFQHDYSFEAKMLLWEDEAITKHVQEFLEEERLAEEKRRQQQAESKLTKKRRKELLQAAKAKLTPDELKAIRGQ